MRLEEGRKEFLAWAKNDAHPEETDRLLQDFLASRAKYPSPENNMDWWVKNKKPVDLRMYMDNFKSKSAKKKEEMAGAKKIYNKDGWMCVHCTTYDAMKYYGKGTKWCIAGNYPGHQEKGEYYFNNYLETNYTGYFVVINNNIKADQSDDSIRSFVNNKWCVCPKQGGTGGSAANGKVDIWNAPDNTVEYIPGVPEIPGLPLLGAFEIKDGVLVKLNTRRLDDSSGAIPNSVVAIGNKAFMSKRVPEEFIMPDSVERIGVGAFAETSIKTFYSDGVNEIGHSCFLGCDNLQTVVLGERLYKLPKRVFGYCDSLKLVVVKGAITELDHNFLEGTDTKNLTIQLMGTNGNEALLEYAKKNNIEVVDGTTLEVIIERN